jgi:hypothetical protein
VIESRDLGKHKKSTISVKMSKIKVPQVIGRYMNYVNESVPVAQIHTLLDIDIADYNENLKAYKEDVAGYIDKHELEIDSVITTLNAEIKKAESQLSRLSAGDKKQKESPVSNRTKTTPHARRKAAIKGVIYRSKKDQYSALVESLKFLIHYAEKKQGSPSAEEKQGSPNAKEKQGSPNAGSSDSSPIGSLVPPSRQALKVKKHRRDDLSASGPHEAMTPNQTTELSGDNHISGRSVVSSAGSGERVIAGSTVQSIKPRSLNFEAAATSLATADPAATADPTDPASTVDPADPAATATAVVTDVLGVGGKAKRLNAVIDNAGAVTDFMIGKSEKQLYYMPVPLKTALEKAEKSDMLRVINKTIREYGAVIGITECTVDMQNSHSELAAYYDILVHRVKGWADSVATLNDPDTPLWKYNPDVLLQRRVAYEAGLAEFQKQLHNVGAVMGADVQRSPAEANRIAADKLAVAKRKFENVTSSDRLKSDNSEAGNRRLAHMFLKSVPPLHMFKKDLAPTSHMSQAPQSQRKMRKVVFNPLQMGPPIVIQFTSVMMKTTQDSDEEY